MSVQCNVMAQKFGAGQVESSFLVLCEHGFGALNSRKLKKKKKRDIQKPSHVKSKSIFPHFFAVQPQTFM